MPLKQNKNNKFVPSQKSPSTTGLAKRTNTENCISKKSTSPIRTLQASVSADIFLAKF